MKRIISIILTVASVMCAFTFAVTDIAAAEDTPTAGAVVLQNLDYEEIIHRVSQGDSGFTMSSKFVYSGSRQEGENPMNDSGFQFYNIDLSRWSSNSKSYRGEPLGYADSEIDEWYLEWLDKSLANLRANGGGCMIRASYALDGQTKSEPADFALLIKHIEQLSSVFAKYSDIVTTVECGMIGAFGEMWGGLYSDGEHKRQVLEAWLTYLPEDISVNARTVAEYWNYINNTEVFKTKYKNRVVNGVLYPDALNHTNYWMYTFPGEGFERIGIYNDAMIQDGNDGGTFTWDDYNFELALQMRAGAFTLLKNQSGVANYGGEFSGAAGIYRWKLDYWMPLCAIPEFYTAHLSYYHGGNNAYRVTGKYYGEYNDTYYYTDETIKGREETLKNNIENVGSGMSYAVTADKNDAKVKYPDGSYSAVMTYDAAAALAEEYNASLESGAATAVVNTKTTLTTGGWSSAIVGDALLDQIAKENEVTADLSDYLGTTVAKFFEDHVGYRIVLRESYISEMAYTGGALRVKGKVDNTGFANITKDKVTELVITDGNHTYVIPTDIDARSWKSAQRTEYDTTVALPDNMEAGEYKVFMRVANKDNEGNTVQNSAIAFANSGEYTYTTPKSQYNVGEETFDSCYDPDLDGNYIGSFTVEEYWENPYKDISIDKWYYRAVKYMTTNGLMNGVTGNSFGPEQSLTRGMLVTVLWRMENSPEVEAAGAFTDVTSDKWYYTAVEWAQQNEIVNGMTATTFAPEANITREQIATIMYRYAGFKGYDTSADGGEMLWNFTDVGDISGYAEESMGYAVGTGLINGKSMMKLCPGDNAKRNEIATILMRFIEGNK